MEAATISSNNKESALSVGAVRMRMSITFRSLRGVTACMGFLAIVKYKGLSAREYEYRGSRWTRGEVTRIKLYGYDRKRS